MQVVVADIHTHQTAFQVYINVDLNTSHNEMSSQAHSESPISMKRYLNLMNGWLQFLKDTLKASDNFKNKQQK